MDVHHIGYAVRSIEKSRPFFQTMGYTSISDVTEDSIRNIKIQFIKNGEYVIELVEPIIKGSPVDGILRKNGEGPYHICYVVDDIEAEVDKLLKNKFKIFQDYEIAPAIDNKKVIFLYNIRVGIIELVER